MNRVTDKDTVKCNCTQREIDCARHLGAEFSVFESSYSTSYTSWSSTQFVEKERCREERKRKEGTVHPVIYIFEVYQ